MKKIGWMLMGAVMLGQVAPMGLVYNTYAYEQDGGELQFDASTGTVVGADKNITIVNIPSEIDGVPVRAIGDEAFKDCQHLRQVVIAPGVSSIGKDAFRGCTSLVDISIPYGVTQKLLYGAESRVWKRITKVTHSSKSANFP